jgi:ribosomal protein L31E
VSSTFKKRAPRAIRAIKAFAEKQMGTKYVLFWWWWLQLAVWKGNVD